MLGHNRLHGYVYLPFFALLALAGLLLLLSNPGIVGRTISSLALAYSSVTVATLLLLVALAWLRFERADPARLGAPEAA